MISDEALNRMREASNKVKANEGSVEYQMNLACWLGERAHCLIAEIDRLRSQKSPDPPSGDMITVAYAIRDTARKARDSNLQKDDDELDRLIGVFNLPAAEMYDAAFRTVEYERRKAARSSFARQEPQS